MYDLKIVEPDAEKFIPLWVGKQKINLDFPIYKYVLDKSPRNISDEKLSKREAWQSIKLQCSAEHELADKLLRVMKREWLHEYIKLLDLK